MLMVKVNRQADEYDIEKAWTYAKRFLQITQRVSSNKKVCISSPNAMMCIGT